MTAAMREYTVDTQRIDLSVRDHAGGAPPVVALHGLASNARWWDLVASRLAPRYRVIAVDQRGHGRSHRTDDGYDFPSVIADLGALVDSLGLPPFVVVGHSWGASVALAFAAARPESVLGTVCIDGGFLRMREHFGESWDLAAVAMRPPEMRGLTPERVRQWMAASPISEGSDLETSVEIMLGNFDLDDATGDLHPRLTVDRHMLIARALWEENPDALLAAQARPVLVMPAGGDGPLRAAKEAAVEQSLAVLGEHGRAQWVTGHHDLPVHRPDDVASSIKGFVETL